RGPAGSRVAWGKRIRRREHVIEIEHAARLVALSEIELNTPYLRADLQRVTSGDLGQSRRKRISVVGGDARDFLTERTEILHARIGDFAIGELAVETRGPSPLGLIGSYALWKAVVAEPEESEAYVAHRGRIECNRVRGHGLVRMKVNVGAGLRLERV